MNDMLNADISFWTGFYGDEDCFTWASNKAYLDMNRTLTFKENPKNDSQKEKNRIDELRRTWRDDVTEIIRKHCRNLPEDFNKFHRSLCKKLIDYYSNDKLVIKKKNKRTDQPAELTYGQAQKWVNMTLKYLWLLYRFELIKDDRAVAFIEKHQNSFHVPLDSYILRYVAKQDKNKKEDFSSSITDNGLKANTDFNEYWKSFGSAWSHIDAPDIYYEYQENLANAILKGSPLEWELNHWHKAIKYYG